MNFSIVGFQNILFLKLNPFVGLCDIAIYFEFEIYLSTFANQSECNYAANYS